MDTEVVMASSKTFRSGYNFIRLSLKKVIFK